jgi:DNA-directed RNA polymerase subunit RPC12/RpoP
MKRIGLSIAVLIIVVLLAYVPSPAVYPSYDDITCTTIDLDKDCYHSNLIADSVCWAVSATYEENGEESLVGREYKCKSCGKRIVIHVASAYRASKFTKAQEDVLEVALKALVDPNR